MNVFVVFAHPDHGSFTGQVLERFLAGLRDGGHRAVVSDLYAEDFDPVLRPREYRREARLRRDAPVAPDVERELERLKAAEAIAFVFPLWWSDVPAILKGWFDRVYAVGRVYAHGSEGHALLSLRRGVVLCTAGHAGAHLEATGVVASLRALMLGDRMANVGIGDPRLVLLAGTADCPDGRYIDTLLEQAYACGARLGDAPAARG